MVNNKLLMVNRLEAMPKYEAYKDSGVEWLGEIPAGWLLRRFKYLTSITTGDKNTEDKIVNGKYPFFVRSQISERINTYSFEGEAILTSGDGAGVGKIYHYINGKFDFHQRVYKFSDFNLICGSYLFRYLSTNFYRTAMKGTAKSTVDSLRLPLIQNFVVCFPESKREQTAIANFLDQKTSQIDQAIAIKEKQISLLKERKQILIQQAVTRGLNPNAPMRDSGVEWVGEIPEHWEVERSKWIFTQRKERARKGDEQLTTSQKYGVIPQKEFMRIEGRRVTQVEFNSEILKHVEKNDFVISMRSFQGGIEFSPYMGCVSSAYVALKPGKQVYFPFFKYLLKCPRYIEALQSTSNLVRDGQALRFDNFSMVDLLIIPKEEQKKISEYIDCESEKINQIIDIQNQQIKKLKEYKTTLINSAVTGKIKILSDELV